MSWDDNDMYRAEASTQLSADFDEVQEILMLIKVYRTLMMYDCQFNSPLGLDLLPQLQNLKALEFERCQPFSTGDSLMATIGGLTGRLPHIALEAVLLAIVTSISLFENLR